MVDTCTHVLKRAGPRAAELPRRRVLHRGRRSRSWRSVGMKRSLGRTRRHRHAAARARHRPRHRRAGFVRDGAKVVVADSGTSIGGDGADPAIADGGRESIGARRSRCPDSVASPGAAQALVELAVERCGGIDIVVNNAAIIRDALVFKGEPRDWDAVIHTKLNAAYYLDQRRDAGDARAVQGGAPAAAPATTGAASSTSARRRASTAITARPPTAPPRPGSSRSRASRRWRWRARA